jgi:RNA polymerase sigma factor (sigma-70 family)
MDGELNEGSLMRMLRNDMKPFHLLNKEEEIELSRRAKDGDSEAIDRLIESNLRLVLYIVFKMWHPGLPLMDLVSEGFLGLMRSIKDFNPKLGWRIATYAAPAIRNAVINAIKLEEKHSHNSLDDVLYEEDETTLKDIIREDDSTGDDLCRSEEINRLLSAISKRELSIIRLRFWGDKTLDEISSVIGVSRESVRQAEVRALRKLRWRIYKTGHKEDWAERRAEGVFIVA